MLRGKRRLSLKKTELKFPVNRSPDFSAIEFGGDIFLESDELGGSHG